MNAAQADWDDQHGRLSPSAWLASLSNAEQAALAEQYAAKLARMLGPNPVRQEGDGS